MKFLGHLAKGAATLAATAVNPALGVVVGGAFAGGEGGKRLGKRIQAKTGKKAHKATGPLGAIAIPAAIVPVAGALGVDTGALCETVQSTVSAVCSSPGGAAGLISILTLLLHGASRNSTRAPSE